MPVTINDIAKAANVSPSTVSRVIANSGLIGEKTRKKVIKIMKEMDYHPNMIARSLVSKSTKIIGAVLPGTSEKSFQHPFFPEIIRGLTSEAAQYGYRILLSNFGGASEESATIDELVNGQIAEGLVIMSSRLNDRSVSDLVSKKFPFVMVGRPESDFEDQIDWVDNDNVAAGYRLTKRFISRGCKKIAFIGVSPDYMVTVDRLAGYKKALAEDCIPFDERLIVDGKFMDDNGYEMVKELFSRDVKPDGIIAGDDFQAVAAIKYLNGMGVKVPDEIFVAGFNNVPLAAFYIPSLTSVEVYPCRLGKRAFDILHERIEDRSRHAHHEFIAADIVARKSC